MNCCCCQKLREVDISGIISWRWELGSSDMNRLHWKFTEQLWILLLLSVLHQPCFANKRPSDFHDKMAIVTPSITKKMDIFSELQSQVDSKRCSTLYIQKLKKLKGGLPQHLHIKHSHSNRYPVPIYHLKSLAQSKTYVKSLRPFQCGSYNVKIWIDTA